MILRYLSILAIGACLLRLGSTYAGAFDLVVPSRYSKIDSDLFRTGVIEAERFRRSLLEKHASGGTLAETIAGAIVRFQKSARSELDERVKINSFRLDEKEIIRAITGSRQRLDLENVFRGFHGKWYGVWDQMEVDHEWMPTQVFDPPLVVEAFHSIHIHAVQFAWIGDGFGWNIVAGPHDDSKARYILGTVYHVEGGDVTRIRLHRPHVGIRAGRDRLIWFTRGEIFLEERFKENRKHPERYAITGFNYVLDGANLSNRGNVFQAIYTRDRDVRPPWYQFWLPISVTAD